MNSLAEIDYSISATRPDSAWFVEHPQLGVSLIQHLFNRLDGAYPHKWRSNFPTPMSVENWAESWVEAFDDEGITPQLVQAGLKECRRRFTWPPSCAEFISACRPEIDPVMTYHEAVAGLEARGKGEAGTWSHPAVFWAASLLARELMSQAYGQVKEKWAAALNAQLGRAEWATIPEPRVRLAAPDVAELSREEADAQLRKLHAAAVIAPKGDGYDHLGWARKVLQREAAGDKNIHMMQIKMAKEALGI